MKAALYTRVSTRDKGQETANQERQLRDFAISQGWTITTVYEDHESGGRPDRAQFQAMMLAASQRQFDVVLFWSLDRFTREGALETLQYLNQLSNYGVAFRSFTEPYLDSCGMFKDAVIAILGTIAKQERLRMSERVKAGLSRARAQGTKTGKAIGRPKIVFRRDQVAELRKEGYSWSEIASRMGATIATVRRACPALPSDSRPCQNPSEQIICATPKRSHFRPVLQTCHKQMFSARINIADRNGDGTTQYRILAFRRI